MGLGDGWRVTYKYIYIDIYSICEISKRWIKGLIGQANESEGSLPVPK